MAPAPNRTELPEAFSSVIGLGAPVDFFPQSKSSRLISPILAGFLIIASMVSCGWGLDTGYGAYLRYGLSVIYDLSSPALFVAFGLLIIGIILLGFSIANRSRCVTVFEKGLAYYDRKGLQSMRWEEIGEFYLSIARQLSFNIPTRTTYLYTVNKLGGGKLVFDNRFERIQHLGSLIGRNILPIQYKLAADVYNSGQAASFGPVVVSRAGLTVSKKTYPWTEIEQVSVQQGMFKISKKGGGWFSGASTSVASIPNLEAMLSIIDQVVGVKVG